jgi:xanthine dehydrogenase accessory factor
MTVGHKSDLVVLKQMVTKNLKYLGMIGSKNKVKTIYESLKSKGISESDLANVDSPIGLSINSQTTPEIAISIAAKVIQVKNC